MRTALAAVAIAAAAITAQPASATTTYNLALGTNATSDGIFATVQTSPGVYESGVYVGPINMAVTNTSTNLTADQLVFCTDTAYNFTNGTYTLNGLSTGFKNQSLSTGQIKAIGILLQNVTINSDLTNDAAIQGAIWTIENDYSSTNVMTVVTGGDGTFNHDADVMLTNVYGSWSGQTVTDTISQYQPYPIGSGDQSFGFLTVGSNNSQLPMPEPTSLALLAAGVLGLAGLRRRA